MSYAIRVENLSKTYWISRSGGRLPYRTLRDDLARWFRAPLQSLSNNRAATEQFFALSDVSFDVAPGTALGVIGRNGAGKSTILKIMSRITEPTSGRVRLRGRVGSLLEIGTGFHPELTGRENIFLSGAVLGMTRSEVAKKFDAIVDFAEIERFLDVPAKRYSSGMYTRLAFAVAAHLEPEILLIDEVLAVGDAAFQKKCLGRMGEVAGGGRTVLFVSHNMEAVRRLCGQSVLLTGGRLADFGPSERVIAKYLEHASVERRQFQSQDQADRTDSVRLLEASIPEEDVLRVDTPVSIDFKMWNPRAGMILNFSASIWTDRGVMLFNTYSTPQPHDAGVIAARLTIPPNIFNSGSYSVELLLVVGGMEIVATFPDVLTFFVQEPETDSHYEPRAGAIRPKVDWTFVKSVDASAEPRGK